MWIKIFYFKKFGGRITKIVGIKANTFLLSSVILIHLLHLV